MKKFVFAAIAAMVMVSVSNVFASGKMMIALIPQHYSLTLFISA